MARKKSRPLWLKVSTILLAILLLASPLMIGGVHALSAAMILAVALGVAILSEGAGAERQTRTRMISIPAAVFAMLGMLSVLQALPMPMGLVELVSPRAAQALQQSWEAAFGQATQPSFRPISLNAPASAAHALKWFALSLGALAVSNLGRWRALRRQGLAAGALAAAGVAVAGALQTLSGTDKILGVYQASLTPRAWAPFVSTNHASTYYALATLVAAGAALVWARRHRPLSAAMMVLAALFGALTLAHRSQGALLALGAGALAGAAVMARHASRRASDALLAETNDETEVESNKSERNEARSKKMLIGAGALIAALGIAAIALPENLSIANTVGQTSLEVRVHMSLAALRAAGDYWLFGAGAGAVGLGLPAYLDPQIVGMHSVPTIENELVEWIFAYGLLVGPATLVLLALSLGLLVRGALRSDNPQLGAISVALATALAVAALFHFPFFTLGIALPTVMLIELCFSGKSARSSGFRRSLSPRAYRIALGSLAAGAILAGGLHWGLYHDEAQALENDPERALALFPTDGAALANLSVEARRAGQVERALALAQRAYTLNPFPHQGLVLARAWVAQGELEQAAEIWRELYAEPHLAPASWLGAFLLKDLRDAELRAHALKNASEVLLDYALRESTRVEGPEVAAELALAMLNERPESPALHLGLVRIYGEQGLWELSELWAGQLLARDLRENRESQQAALRELFRIYHRQERPEAALELGEQALRRGWLGGDVARTLLLVAAPDPKPEAAQSPRQELLRQVYAIGCAPPLRAGDQRVCWRSEAALAESAEDLRRARVLLERLNRHYDEPRDLARFLARHGQCIDLTTLSRAHGEGPHARALRQQRSECARHP